MYGLRDSAVVGTYKRAKHIGGRKSHAKNSQGGLLFAYLIILLIQKWTKKK